MQQLEISGHIKAGLCMTQNATCNSATLNINRDKLIYTKFVINNSFFKIYNFDLKHLKRHLTEQNICIPADIGH